MPNHPPVGVRAQANPEYCPPGSFAGTQAENEALTLVSMSWTSAAGTAALVLISVTLLIRSSFSFTTLAYSKSTHIWVLETFTGPSAPLLSGIASITLTV